MYDEGQLNSGEGDIIGKVRFELSIKVRCLFGVLGFVCFVRVAGKVGIDQICTKNHHICMNTNFRINFTGVTLVSNCT